MQRFTPAKIIAAGILVGTLDIIAACIQFYSNTGMGPAPVLRYIARAAIGPAANSGGNEILAAGLLFHYCIAMGFTLLFFFLYKNVPAFSIQPVLTAILYGIFMWAFMFFIVLPLSRVGQPPFHFQKALIAIVILIVCISTPLVLLARTWSTRHSP